MTTEKFDFGVESKKILKLMIHSLYANKDVAIRELVSNASDACDKLRYKATQDDSLLADDKDLKIKISINEKEKTLTISDNGIGMDKKELITQLGTIAHSGTEKFLKSVSEDKEKTVELIGQFGVGFYSSFMVADEVTVISRKAGKKKANIWKSKGEGSYTVEETNEEHPRGTQIILHLKKDETNFTDQFHVEHVVKTYSDHISIPVELILENGNAKVINTGTALWRRDKKDIKKEQYSEFYKHISHLAGDPFMTLHNKSEGVIEFTNLLFVPTTKPMDLFHPDRNSRVKLYVKKVFITDEAIELLPKYLRFVQGVVDSEDLPLNISRETLQHNTVVEKIRKSITNRVLNELAIKAEKDSEKYMEFWKNFGPVLKEGLCEGFSDKEKLLKICRFYSSKSTDKTISPDEYVDRMQKDQKNIFFITGESIEKIDNSPQVEGFKAKDIEVLYLLDTVDDFWVTTTREYKQKEFKSITRSDIDVENLNTEKEEKEDKKDDKKDITNSKLEGLIKLMQTVLEGKVKDIKVSKKLTNSPVCLVADQNAMDIRLERYLVDQKQVSEKMLKILEINADHKIIKNLNSKIGKQKETEELKDTIKTLYDQACVLEGEAVDNPGEFAKRLNKLLEE